MYDVDHFHNQERVYGGIFCRRSLALTSQIYGFFTDFQRMWMKMKGGSESNFRFYYVLIKFYFEWDFILCGRVVN